VDSIPSAKSVTKEECAMNATLMQLMVNYMEDPEHQLVQYARSFLSK